MAGDGRKSHARRVHTFPVLMWMSWGQPDLPAGLCMLTVGGAELKYRNRAARRGGTFCLTARLVAARSKQVRP